MMCEGRRVMSIQRKGSEYGDICRFIEKQGSDESVHTVNFVREVNVRSCSDKNTTYRMELVSEGEGYLHVGGMTVRITRGDMFFLFPNVPYVIESITDDFKYMYISYVGVRAGEIMDKLKISGKNFLFHGYEGLIPAWEIGLAAINEVSNLSSEGILLLSFAAMGKEKMTADEDKERKVRKTVAQIKKYIDDNFSVSDLSLEKISTELFYNKKYISYIFKREMHLGVSDYLNTVRIQHACTLMEQGMTSVKDIALMCGFRDALYFSRVFKQKMMLTPTEHIAKLK